MGKAKPQVIDDDEQQRVFDRVAAVDVAKATGMVCVRLPRQDGSRYSKVWEVTATMGAVTELGRQLMKDRIEMVTLEATSDYWRIFYYVLEMCGLAVQLVSPSQAKNLKGRPKTDKLDSMWLARLTEWGMLRPCFVPPAPVRALRDYTRARTGLVRERTRCWQRLEKLLEGALIKLSSVGPDAAVLPAALRLAEIPGVSEQMAAAIIAETGLDMTRFPAAAHLVSWAGLCRVASQSGPRSRGGKKVPGVWRRGVPAKLGPAAGAGGHGPALLATGVLPVRQAGAVTGSRCRFEHADQIRSLPFRPPGSLILLDFKGERGGGGREEEREDEG